MKRLMLLVFGVGLSACPPVPSSDVCPASLCNGHGTCREVAQFPQCECQPGYGGPTCAVCLTGTRAVGNDCVPDEVCDDRCGPNGACVVVEGVASCRCAVGYDGPTCRTCNAGFTSVEDGGVDGGVTCAVRERCNAGSCAADFACDDSSGRITCACAGAQCGPCTPDVCGPNGTCREERGVVTCTCAPGFQGPQCGRCSPGFAPMDGGACAPAESCLPSTCSGGGSCSASTGKALCTCGTGYSGLFCERCAAGFHRDARGECVVDETCTASSCSATATCEVTSGVVGCRCLPGYAGQTCAQCAPGHHREASGCVLDQRCFPGSCGPAACEDGTGRIVCLGPDGGVGCPPGFSGAFCEVETLGCGAACNTGRCLRVGTGTQCLCTDGRYGPSCLPGPMLTTITPATVALRGGTTLTLTGTGFVTGSTVTIGGVMATGVTFISATEYRVTSPAATRVGPSPVVLRAPNAQTATGSVTVAPLAFTFDGGVQSFVVPAGVTSVSVQAWGGGGGAGRAPSVRGGAGGFASATVDVTPGETVLVLVGEGGASFSGALLPDGGAAPAAGAGGGLTGVFRPQSDGGLSAPGALLIAGGGGGGGQVLGAMGGNGGGLFGASGAVVAGGPVDAQGVGGSPQAGGVGGCNNGALCGQTGLSLQGGGGGVMSVGMTRLGATFGGGGGVGLVNGAYSAGGGGGWFGGGGGANGGALGGGGGSGFLATAARDGVLERGSDAGVPSGLDRPGYLSPSGHGGRAQPVPAPTGGHGLLLIGW